MADPISEAVSNLNPMDNLSRKDQAALANLWQRLSSNPVPTVLYTLAFLTPLLFLPILNNVFDLPKSLLLSVLGLWGVIFWAIKAYKSGKVSLSLSLFDLPVLLLALVSAVSLVSGNDNKLSFLLNNPTFLGNPGLVPILTVLAYMLSLILLVPTVSSALIFFLTNQAVATKKTLDTIITVLLSSGVVLTILAVLQLIYQFVGPKLNLGTGTIVASLLSSSFSPVGSALSQAIFLAALLPLAIGFFMANRQAKKTTAMVLVVAIAVGLVITIYGISLNKPVLLDQNSGWKIATGVMSKSFGAALIGLGPNNFIDAFTAYKPVDFNASPYWNLRFSTSSNYYFVTIATLGIIGLALIIFFISRLARLAKKRLDSGMATPLEKGLLASLGLLLVLIAFLPAPITVIYLLFVLAGLIVAYWRVNEVSVGTTTRVIDLTGGKGLVLIAVPVLCLVAVLISGIGSMTIANYYYQQSQLAAAQNRATDTYNLQIRTIQTDPWNDTYHVAYSQTNLALANALAGQTNLSDQQKQTVVTLVQQAIRESRTATALEPERSADWENLSLIYRNLINFAQGADQWAVASQNQAITLDPTNPRLRLDLGGIYFAQKDYQSAGQIFAQAVSLKQDYANAYYNLAQAEKQLKLDSQALSALQQAATLVCASGIQSSDCQLVNSEIQALGSQPATASPSAQALPTQPVVNPGPLATPAAATNLPKAKTQPPVTVSTNSGQITP